ncbi:ABC transporter substrate-binding protein [Streptomyces hawaiiensis]|uniref:ABC transporter substrate-binding protein n=1 Tax=Streptomyces hawaiiensis TaxID=67305 RepID=UPI0036683A85
MVTPDDPGRGPGADKRARRCPVSPPAGATAIGLRPWRRPSGRRLAAAVAAVLLGLAAVVAPRLAGPHPTPVYVALVTSHSGAGAVRGEEITRGIEFQLERINRDSGVSGHPVRLLKYDDGADPQVARRTAHRIVRDDRVALVIGNTTSPTALQAAPVYDAAGVPFITPTATADGITGSRWCFRTTYTNTYQASFIAAYAHHVLNARSATVLYATDAYGTSLKEGFRRSFSRVGRVHGLVALDNQDTGRRAQQLRRVLETVRADPDDGPVVLAMDHDLALTTLTHLRAHGVRAEAIGGDALSNAQFASALARSAQERSQRQSMTDRFYAASPQLADSLTGEGLEWVGAYRDRYGDVPSWKAMAAKTAIDLAVESLRRAGVHHPHVTAIKRTAVRDALASVDSPARAIRGWNKPVFFDHTRSMHRHVIIGRVQDGDIVSAPVQLTGYDQTDDIDVDEELATGRAIRFEDQVLARQQIVHTGVNVNQVTSLKTHEQTFKADFFLWLRYSGDDAAADVEFPALADQKFKLPKPARESTVNGITYRLYQIATTFSASLDFHDFPFDQQHLRITVQNRVLPSSRVIYVVDEPVLKQDRTTALQSGQDVALSIDGLPNWTVDDLHQYTDTVGSTARLGDPDLARSENGIHRAQYVADVTVARDVGPFLVKNLLPLLLSAAITYATLFFPRDPRYTSTRISLEATAMLSAAVLLTNVTGSLPDIGYSVALEWAYYAFMFLVGTCVFISLAGAWLVERDSVRSWNRLAHASRIYYPVFCLAVLLVYVVHFG